MIIGKQNSNYHNKSISSSDNDIIIKQVVNFAVGPNFDGVEKQQAFTTESAPMMSSSSSSTIIPVQDMILYISSEFPHERIFHSAYSLLQM